MQTTLISNRSAAERLPLLTLRRVNILFWSLAIILGAIQAFANRYAMNSDGITYLDMGEGLFHGDWKAILNCLWSPMYPSLLGLTQYVAGSSPYSEFPVAHLTNFAIYVVALLAFTFFLRNLVEYVRSEGGGLPEWSLLVIGYSIFIWASLCLIDLAKVCPDMGMSAFLYTAVGLLIRIRLGHDSLWSYAALGLILGFGFLAKAPILPIAVICLIVSLFAASERRKGVLGSMLAGLLTIAVICPYTVELSLATGRLTFGDSARLNYAWHVNGVSMYHWRGEIPGSGSPKHPTRKLLSNPAVYEFGSPIRGTYPPWFDASYWNDGLLARYRIADQLAAAYSCTSEYLNLFLGIQGGLLVGISILLFVGSKPMDVTRNVIAQWVVLAAPVAGLAMYQMIHFESRYVAAYLVLFWMGLLAAVRVEHSYYAKRLIATITISLTLLLIIRTATTRLGPTVQSLADALHGRGSRTHEYWQIAEGLRGMGVRPGESFAIIRSTADAYYWARLAHVRVIAELPGKEAADFWSADRDVKAKVMKAFASTGVRGVVTPQAPSYPEVPWQRIGHTGYWVYLFRN